MDVLSNIIENLPEYNQLSNIITKNDTPAFVCGVSHIQKANFVANINLQFNRQCLLITANDEVSKRLAIDIEAFSNKKPLILSARDLIFHNISSSSNDLGHKRIETLHKIQNFNGVILASIDSLLLSSIPKDILNDATFTLKVGENFNILDLAKKLVNCGYTRTMEIDGISQFSLRGGILDIFPIGRTSPVRIEFFDDEIDSISSFNLDSKRREVQLDDILILPAFEILPAYANGGVTGIIDKLKGILNSPQKKSKELIFNIQKDIERFENEYIFPTLDRYLTQIYTDIQTPIHYLKDNAIIFIDDLAKVSAQADGYFKRFNADLLSLLERGVIVGNKLDYLLDFNSLYLEMRKKNLVSLDTFLQKSSVIEPKHIINVIAKQLPSYSGNLDVLKDDINFYIKNNFKVLVVCKGQTRLSNMSEILAEFKPKIGNSLREGVTLFDGYLSSGFEYTNLKIAVLTEGQLINTKPKKAKKSNRQHIKSYTDLKVGDIIVHEHHGIGRFTGIEKMIVDSFERDYIKICFAGTDSLFVPVTNLNLISKYIGKNAEQLNVKLNKLGGTDWQKSKVRAKAAAKDLAKYLIDLYAKRKQKQGFAFAADDVFQTDFESAFLYEETDDQLTSIAEIKADMERPIPMNRLLCGDVGFGKTEVAFRAIMKCLLSSKQAAILVPTTVLARQHYMTALSRFNGFPIKIEFISRFKTPKEEKLIYERLKEGKIDLIIGTHKLLSKNIKFKDLGLLVIDEEQRFGVLHKEKLKELGEQIDVLTLSATPIPRTLNMALSGISDMSVLEEPPHNRQPIETYVLEYDFNIICDAISKELSRGGQCFYLHNRVDTIDTVAAKIQAEFENAVVMTAHGKMSQKDLANIMGKMSDGEIDILVATTIIETGIDISNANTLIIEDSDRMGLSALHQIRGRIGRSNRTSYAYLTYKSGKVLSEDSTKRLQAIKEFAEFGSGFKIAMRDLEIRGAGDILGSSQSGHLATIGYDLYLKILEDAILEEQGTPKKAEIECSIDILINANIDSNLVSDIGTRIDLYRRIAMIKTENESLDLIDEIIDRYGDAPTNILNLCKIAYLRNNFAKFNITNIKQKELKVILDFSEPDMELLSKICAKYNGKMLLGFANTPYLTLKIAKTDKILLVLEQLLEDLLSF